MTGTISTLWDARQHRHHVLGSLMVAFFSAMLARLFISPLVPSIIDHYGVSKGTVGLALTGMWGTYALFQYPGSVLGQRFDERVVVLAGIAITAGASFLLYLSVPFVGFAILVGLLGVGAGIYYPTASSILTGLFENRGQALGFHVSGGNLAGLLAPVVATTVALHFGWQSVYLVAVAIAGVAFIACAISIRGVGLNGTSRSDGAAATRRMHPSLTSMLHTLARPPVVYTLTLAILLAFGLQSVFSFYPTYLIEYAGLTQTWASNLFSILFAFMVVSIPIVGRLSDVFDHDTVIGLVICCQILGLWLTLSATSLTGVLAGTCILGFGLSWGGVVASRVMSVFTETERLTGFGAVRTGYILVGSTGNVVTGLIADVAGWTPAWNVVVALLGLALAGVITNKAFMLEL